MLCISELTSVSEISSFSAERCYAEYTDESPCTYAQLHRLNFSLMKRAVQGQAGNKVISQFSCSYEWSKHRLEETDGHCSPGFALLWETSSHGVKINRSDALRHMRNQSLWRIKFIPYCLRVFAMAAFNLSLQTLVLIL